MRTNNYRQRDGIDLLETDLVESVDNNQQLPVSASAVAKSALNDIDGFGAINDELRFVHSSGQVAADLEAHFRCTSSSFGPVSASGLARYIT
jgi:hypothetical protein